MVTVGKFLIQQLKSNLARLQNLLSDSKKRGSDAGRGLAMLQEFAEDVMNVPGFRLFAQKNRLSCCGSPLPHETLDDATAAALALSTDVLDNSEVVIALTFLREVIAKEIVPNIRESPSGVITFCQLDDDDFVAQVTPENTTRFWSALQDKIHIMSESAGYLEAVVVDALALAACLRCPLRLIFWDGRRGVYGNSGQRFVGGICFPDVYPFLEASRDISSDVLTSFQEQVLACAWVTEVKRSLAAYKKANEELEVTVVCIIGHDDLALSRPLTVDTEQDLKDLYEEQETSRICISYYPVRSVYSRRVVDSIEQARAPQLQWYLDDNSGALGEGKTSSPERSLTEKLFERAGARPGVTRAHRNSHKMRETPVAPEKDDKEVPHEDDDEQHTTQSRKRGSRRNVGASVNFPERPPLDTPCVTCGKVEVGRAKKLPVWCHGCGGYQHEGCWGKDATNPDFFRCTDCTHDKRTRVAVESDQN